VNEIHALVVGEPSRSCTHLASQQRLRAGGQPRVEADERAATSQRHVRATDAIDDHAARLVAGRQLERCRDDPLREVDDVDLVTVRIGGHCGVAVGGNP